MTASLHSAEGELPEAARADNVVHVVFHPRHRCLLAARIASEIQRIHCEEGQAFAKEAPLVTLDASMYAATVEKAEARVKSAEMDLALLDEAVPRAQVAKAKAWLQSTTVTRQAKESLFKDNAIARTEVEEARAAEKMAEADLAIAEAQLAARGLEVQRAQAAVKAARADLKVATEQFQACAIRAPFAGRVVKIFANPHEQVQQGQKLMEILDDSVLLAQFFVPAADLDRARLGMEVKIAVRETGTTVIGTISQVSAEVNPVTSTATVFAEVQNAGDADKRLQSGMRGLLAPGSLSP